MTAAIAPAGSNPARGAGRAFCLLWVALMLLASALPTLLAWREAPPGHEFTWSLPPYPEDSLSYQAWARQAMNGHLLFKLKYTPQPHRPFLFQPFFIAAGLLARATGTTPGFALFLLKCVGVAVFWLVFFRFTTFLRLPRGRTRLAAVLLGLASGLGAPCVWLLGPDGAGSADLWLVDLTTCWSLEWNAVFPWSLSLILSVVMLLWGGFRKPAARSGTLAGLLTGLLAFVHPYHVPMLLLFAGVCALLIRRRGWWKVAVPFLAIAVPLAGLAALPSWRHPLLAQHAATGRMPSPPLLPLLLGLGIPFGLALAGLGANRRRLRVHAPLAAWIALSLALAYAPFWFQRKLLFGLQVPIAIWAAHGLAEGLRSRTWSALLLVLALCTPPYLLHTQFRTLRASRGDADPFTVAPDLASALAYLRDQVDPDEIVVASYETSRLIPALAGQTVLWGHWAQSVDLAARREEMTEALRAPRRPHDRRAAAFWASGARYALTDPTLLGEAAGTIPSWLAADTRVLFQRGAVRVLERIPPPQQRADTAEPVGI